MQQPRYNPYPLNRPIRQQNQTYDGNYQDCQSFSHNGQNNYRVGCDRNDYREGCDRNDYREGCDRNDYCQPRPTWNNYNDKFARYPPNANTPPFAPGYQKRRPSKTDNGIHYNDGNIGTQGENESCKCEPCDQDFKNRHALQQHEKQHRRCQEDGCNFTASAKALHLHFVQVHQEGKFKIVLESSEDIEKWKEERKRNWPTPENIEAKKQKLIADKEDGILVKTKEFVYRERDSGRGRGRGRGRHNKGVQLKYTSRNQGYRDRNDKHHNRHEERNVTKHSVRNNSHGERARMNSDSDNNEPGVNQNITPISTNENQTHSLMNDSRFCPVETLPTQIDHLPKEGDGSFPSTCVNTEGDHSGIQIEHSHTESIKGVDINPDIISSDTKEENSGNIVEVSGECCKNDNDGRDINVSEEVIPVCAVEDTSNKIYDTNKVSRRDECLGHASCVSSEKEDGELDTEDECFEAEDKELTKKLDSNVSGETVMTEITNDDTNTVGGQDKSADNTSVVHLSTEKEDGELDTEDCSETEDKDLSKKLDSNVSSRTVMTEITNDIHQQSRDCEDLVENKSASNPPHTTRTRGHRNKHKGKRKRNNTRPREVQPPPERRVSLLEMLLANEIRHERNVILQCIRYIVKNNFFLK